MFYQLEATPAREVIPSFRAKMLHSANMTFAFWDVAAGGILPEHHHPHEQVAIPLEGHFELTIDGETSVLVPGMVGRHPLECAALRTGAFGLPNM